MKKIMAGSCNFGNIYTLNDPNRYLESEFEVEVVKALKCLLPDYFVGVFSGIFDFEGEKRKPDLACLHRSFSHWYVIEVEIAGHSLEEHILPQIRCLRYGDPVDSCAKSLSDAFPNISIERSNFIIKNIPRYTAVVDNLRNEKWWNAFSALDSQYLTLSIYKSISNGVCYELEGNLIAKKVNIGFAQYSDVDKCMKISKHCGLSEGAIQMYDQFGNLTEWDIRSDSEVFWISKKHGMTLFEHKSYVQILKDHEGRLYLRQSSK